MRGMWRVEKKSSAHPRNVIRGEDWGSVRAQLPNQFWNLSWDDGPADWNHKPPLLGRQETVPAKPGQGRCLAPLKTPQRHGSVVDGGQQLLAGTLCGCEEPQQENTAQTPGSSFWSMKVGPTMPPSAVFSVGWVLGEAGVVLGKSEDGDDGPHRGSDESFANLARKGFSLFLILKIKEGI